MERETSICINRGVDLGTTALHIAAEDYSLHSTSSLPFPVDAIVDSLDDLSTGYLPHYNSSFRSSPQDFLASLDTYLYNHLVYISFFMFFFYCGKDFCSFQFIILST